jgi:hypothetical protein
MCQKCGKMKDYNQKMTRSAVKWLQTQVGYDNNYKIKYSHLRLRVVDWHILNSVHSTG